MHSLREKYFKKKVPAHHEIELGLLDHDGHMIHPPHVVPPAASDISLSAQATATSSTSTSSIGTAAAQQQRRSGVGASPRAVATVHQQLLPDTGGNGGDATLYRQTYSSINTEVDDDVNVTDLSIGDAAEVGTEDDHEESESHSIHQQLNDIWMTVQLQAVWKPMAFVYIFNIMQIPNVAWQSFLQLSLNFQPWVLVRTY
jgi:hypothetical protein